MITEAPLMIPTRKKLHVYHIQTLHVEMYRIETLHNDTTH